jgi:hypothetical protein|tara:strand:+ start:294 stop:428 length:135 start_codon:yes stop_codon:yes gene_type:complete
MSDDYEYRYGLLLEALAEVLDEDCKTHKKIKAIIRIVNEYAKFK